MAMTVSNYECDYDCN